MKRSFPRAFAVVLLTVVCWASTASAADLFRDGASEWKIVHDAGAADSPILYGVQELVRALERISGATLPTAVGRPGRGKVYVGVDETLPKPGDEVVVIRLKGDSIELVGNEPRAALHAVYAFLQRELGVRWLWPTESGEFLPKLAHWNVPQKDEWRHTPSIRYRGFHLCGEWFQRNEFLVWMARNGLSAHRHGDYRPAEHRFGFYNFHSWTLDFYKRDCYEQHPEYFCEIGGRRLKSNWCFSNDDGADLAGRKIVERLRRNKGHPYDVLTFFLGDNQDYCKCAKCRQMSVSEGFFRYFNRAVKTVRAAYPSLTIGTLAYQQYCPAPDFPVEADFVEYASHDRCNFHVLDAPGCPMNAEVRREMDGWSKTGIRLGEYGYNFDSFSTRSVTQPFFHLIDDQVANAVRRKFVSLIVEAGLSPKSGPEEIVGSCVQRIPELYYARKMWDATTTADDFLDDVTRTAYGPSAAPMKRYFKIMDAAWGADPKRHIGILRDGVSSVRAVLTPQVKEAASAALDEAASKIAAARDQQKAAFKRERILFKQWTDLLDLAEGNAQILRLPKVTAPGTFPAKLSEPFKLMTGKKPSGAEVRAAWSGERLYVEITGVSKETRAAALSLRAAATGDRYRFRVTRAGQRAQEHVSEVGVAEAAYGPAWTGGFKGDRVRLSIPVAAFATLPKKGFLKMGTHVALEGGGGADFPAGEDVHAETVFTDLVAVGVPLFNYVVMKHPQPMEKVRLAFEENGWKGDYATTPAQAEELIGRSHRAFWFRNASLRDLSPRVVETVRRAVRDEGAVILFTGYCRMDVGGFLGDPSYAGEMLLPKSLPLPLRLPTSIAEGAWMTTPYDLTGSVRNKSPSYAHIPAYAQVPTQPELWTVCCRAAAAKGGEIPFLSYRRYGKGVVVLGGEILPYNIYRLLANFLHLATAPTR